MSARERVLAAVRQALSSPRRAPEAIAAEAAALLEPAGAARPPLPSPTLAAAFESKAAALGTTLERVDGWAEVPRAARRYLDAHGLAPSLAVQPAPALLGLDWAGIETRREVAPDEPAALGLALWGVAETGSLVVHSGPDAPILLSFLPLHHLVVLRERTLLAHLEDYAAHLEGTELPRNAILITGPSGTTDIEGSYVRGAHGPGFLHVILVGEDPR